MSSIDLGFAQQIDNKWKLKNKYFPSKIGGKPVFLGLKTIPNTEDLKCLKCEKMLRFLLQIYAPIESKDNAFHRTLFVFCCDTNDCNQYKVLRSQMARINSCYSSDPPNYILDDESYDPKPQQFGHQLCFVCGFQAKNKCSKCLEVSYCSKQHQIMDWKEGNHKQICGSTDDQSIQTTDYSPLFTEYELTIGENDSSDESDSEDTNDSESERQELGKYSELMAKNCPKYQNQNLDKYEDNGSEEQKIFNKFKQMSSEGEVIRYCSYDNKEVEPLWISTTNKPTLPLPVCQYCQSQRRFEFQIMPQLIHKIVGSDHSLDWGTLVVYTCAQSCSSGTDEEYKEEYIWRQTIT